MFTSFVLNVGFLKPYFINRPDILPKLFLCLITVLFTEMDY